MPFTPMATRRPSAPEKHLDLTAQDAAYRPATVKQKVKQWQGDGGGVLETPTPPKAKGWSLPKSPIKSPASPVKEKPALLHKEPQGPLLPEGYQAKPLDIIRDTKTGAHALVKSRSPPKPATTSNKPGPATWDPNRKVFVRKRENKLQAYEEDEMKMATSPKKRVISDGHWRKDKSPIKPSGNPRYVPVAEPKQRIITQKSTPDFRSRPAKPAATAAFAVRKAQERPKWMAMDPTRDPDLVASMTRKRSRSRSRERRGDSSSVNVERAVPRPGRTPNTPQKTPRKVSDRHSSDSDSTERVVGTQRPQTARRTSHRNPPSSPMTSDVGTEDPFSLASPCPDDSISRVGMPKSAPQRLPSRKEQPRKVSVPAPVYQEPIPAKQKSPPGPPPVFGNRIEAWLGRQSDPFWDETTTAMDEARSSIPSPVPEPLRPRKKEDKHASPDLRQPLKQGGQGRKFSYEQDEYVMSGGLKTSPSNKENGSDARKASYELGDEQNFNKRKSSAGQAGIGLGIGLGINMLRREAPTTGKALSTIASEVTQEPYQARRPPPSIAEESYAASSISLTTIGGKPTKASSKKSPSLKRRLTKHDDLMTVLSIPTTAHSLASARSFRKERLRADKQSKEEVLKELATEEEKYRRELLTLVDGIIPVLLSSVLAKSGSCSPSSTLSKDGTKQNATQPIVDMGVALERLKTQHRRMPQTNPGALLVWAQNAARIYEDYIKAWKMGFDDVVINLPKGDKAAWAEGLSQNAAGDLVNGKGERVDVAFLLKRPLVRVKNLTKTFRAIYHLIPSPDAVAMSERYHALMVAARKKSNDELARIEDEAAASIDPTRARDPRSLAPLAGVRIDASRSVRARDYFEMTLRHTTGQQVDCAIEIIIRDNEADPDKGGDVLFCEVSDTGRWLLFPPVIQDMVSARRGKTDSELIMMIRGVASDGNDWSELLTLHSSSEEAVDEWSNMLSDGPVPPSPTATEFTLPMPTPLTPDVDLIPPPLSPTPPSPGRTGRPNVTFKSRTPSPKEVEIPIGEQARKTSKRWSFSIGGTAADLLDQATPRVFKKVSGSHPPGSMDNRRTSRNMSSPSGQRSSRVDRTGDPYAYTDSSVSRDLPHGRSDLSRARSIRSRGTPTKSAPASPRSDYSESTIKDRSPTRSPQPRRPSMTRSRPTGDSFGTDRSSELSYSVWMPSTLSGSHPDDDDISSDEEYDQRPSANSQGSRAQTEPLSPRPALHTRTSSTPSGSMPTIPRIRPSAPSTPASERPMSKGSYMSSDISHGPQTPTRPAMTRSEGSRLSSDVSRDAPSSAPGKLQKFVAGLKSDKSPEPKLTSQTSNRPKSGFFSASNFLKNRRPSSPLKREYDPAAEEAISDTDSEDSYDDIDSLSTHSSDLEDEAYDHFSQASPHVPAQQFPKATPPQSLASMSGPSLEPSNSASQGPNRAVPPSAPLAAIKGVAMIFSWSDRGAWDPLHPVEVSVVVSAGLIEAFSMPDSHSVPSMENGQEVSPSHFNVAPLVALELTPLVPLRRGTALDISIRSPPTDNSQIRSSNNVMFRSRSPEECERLYSLINQARINNATYIALQNARPHENQGTWAAQMDKRNAMRSSSGSFFGLGSRRGSTYRSNSIRKRSSAMSESSVGTMNTAFSALRRLSGTWRRGENSTNSDSLESGYSTPVRNSMMSSGLGPDLALGIKEMKVRIYHRENASKWRDMGSARLTIMLPERPGSAGSPAGRVDAKRILVKGTTKGETLLDETLAEGAFERVARTGIAVSVWRDNAGSTEGVGRAVDKGGVGANRMDVYMVQMKSERDAAYTFGLVGKLRY
ncbi:hypothetical protein BDZ85DRAFT_296753 [Elsinoe ampelina]|uniref:DH domain-containing protein n=1 Tax=Elsinoe ampelina TaxID=302913 RepID=A0A6A6GAD4_9PEZI|nr:hypothetical protein BDZ85DRAFT_296753 [Elsinoe ampelina]